LSRIETRFAQDRSVNPARSEIRGNKKKALSVNLIRRVPLESLCRRMIDFPKARSAKFPMKRQGEGIKASAQNDDLRNFVLKRVAGDEGEAFLSQRIMPQDSGNAVLFEKIRCPEKPGQAGKSKKQSRSRGVALKKLGAEIC
jgi:hypothetical protein